MTSNVRLLVFGARRNSKRGPLLCQAISRDKEAVLSSAAAMSS